MVKIPQEMRQKIFDYVLMQMEDTWQNAESFDSLSITGKTDAICLKIDEIIGKVEMLAEDCPNREQCEESAIENYTPMRDESRD